MGAWGYVQDKDGVSIGDESALQLNLVEFEEKQAAPAVSTPATTGSPTQKENIRKDDIVKAIADQAGGTDDLLTFAAGDRILITAVSDDNIWAWGYVQDKDGVSIGDEGSLQLNLVEFEK